MVELANNCVQSNVDILGILDDKNENYKIFNGDGFMEMDSLWFLLHLIATVVEEHEEPHILSCHHAIQTRHHYLIEAAGDIAFIF